MNSGIQIELFQDVDFEDLLAMGQKLWNDFKKEELRELISNAVKSEKVAIWIASAKSQRIGFAIFSIRSDYVEGATHSPTGYLEGIFVEEAFRKHGIARDFMKLGEAWCKSKNCIQIGSDTWLDNLASRKFHKQLGFKEEEELVHFLKDIE